MGPIGRRIQYSIFTSWLTRAFDLLNKMVPVIPMECFWKDGNLRACTFFIFHSNQNDWKIPKPFVRHDHAMPLGPLIRAFRENGFFIQMVSTPRVQVC